MLLILPFSTMWATAITSTPASLGKTHTTHQVRAPAFGSRGTVLGSRMAAATGFTRIQRLIEKEGAVLMPGCYDALSAAIVQKSGFSAGFISGYAVSASLLGKPDFGLLTIAFTIKQAGADACFVEAPRDDDELKEIGRRTNGYRVCNMLEGGTTPLHTPNELKAMGFHLIVHPLTALYASARALIDILKTLKEAGTTRDQLHKLATFEEFNKLVELESWFELEARYSQLRTPV